MGINVFDHSTDKVWGNVPPPPPLPKYDPKEEAPKWNWSRLRFGLPVDKGPKEFTPVGTQPENPDDPDWRGVIRNNVIEYEMPEPYNLGKYNPDHYFWFDTPDYADPFKKLWYSAKWFLWSGTITAALRGALECRKCTWSNNKFLLGKVVLPWFTAGMAASVTVLVVANLRGKKDDIYNYVPAGAAMAAVMGFNDHARLFRWTVMSIPAAIACKHIAETNGILVPIMNQRLKNWSLSGNDTQHGFWSGDFRFGLKSTWDDPGRDLRKPY